ncbi:MAG: Dabb family protein [Prolixibacteraceae bacterium]|jgi:hypothetical protein|nr:Dabb family protein [Prolixibacteraceae bacterium]
MNNRRNFIQKIAAGLSSAGLFSIVKTGQAAEIKFSKTFVHQVYFWLRNPKSEEDREAFEKGVEALLRVPVIKASHVGKPVPSDRDVVDDSFTYSYMVMFDSSEDHDVYQSHPIHLKFVEDCSHLWEKVTVYDAMG